MAPVLDHVILLLPHADVIDTPKWLTDLFVVSAGGKHADGKTENKLVLFEDGTYLELIAFVDDSAERRRGHWWDRDYGVVDWALTTSTDSVDVPAINERLAETGISYASPQEGGRLRPDGTEVKWRVTFPNGAKRGAVPFWCNDITPRDRRVPVTKENTAHPCGATGMSGVQIEAHRASVPRISKATAAIFDVAACDEHAYQLDVPHGVSGATAPSIRIIQLDAGAEHDLSLSLVLQSPKGNADVCRDIAGGRVSILFEKAK